MQQMKVETKTTAIGLDCYLTWSFARSFRGREEAAVTAYCETYRLGPFWFWIRPAPP